MRDADSVRGGWALIRALSVGLSFGYLDSSLGLLRSGRADWHLVTQNTLAVALCVGLIGLMVRGVARRVLRRRDLSSDNLALAAVALVYAVALSAGFGAFTGGGFRHLLARGGFALVLSLGAAVGLYATARWLRGRQGPRLLAAAPWLCAAATLWVFVHLGYVRGLFSTTALVVNVTFLLVAAGLLYVCRRRARDSGRFAVLFLVGLTLAMPLRHVVGSWSTSPQPILPGGGPSILLVTIDSLRADRVRCQGVGSPTPEIDQLCADSVRFRQALAPSPWTLPSVASILTGVSPLVHGVTHLRAGLPDGLETLAEQLRGAHYATHAIVQSPLLSADRGFGRGFEDYESTMSRPSAGWTGLALADLLRSPSPTTPGALTDAALDWLAEGGEAPFFLWLHYFDPHLPYAPAKVEGDGLAVVPASAGARIRGGQWTPSASVRHRIEELYDLEVAELDRQIGRLLEGLRESGRYDPMLVVLTSDHGEEFWDHGGFEHGHTLYDELLRVPLLLKLPGGGSRSVDHPVSIERLAPTILDIAGLAEGTGDSLTQEWLEVTDRWQRPVIGTATLYFDDRLAVVFENYKYIESLQSADVELFDRTLDPSERDGRAAADYPDILSRARDLVSLLRSGARADREARGLPADSPATHLDAESLDKIWALGYLP